MPADYRSRPIAAAALAAGLPAVLSLLIAVSAAAESKAPAPGAEQAPVEQGQPILDDATLRQEYEAYRASLEGMRLYRVSYIRVSTEAQARELIARIHSGADFPALARRHSTHAESSGRGGDLGSHASCRWGRSTLEILDSLHRGQTWAKPVKGTHGWGIYRLDAVAPIMPRSFASYKRELLSGRFEPECPWVPPLTVAPAPAGPAAGPGADIPEGIK